MSEEAAEQAASKRIAEIVLERKSQDETIANLRAEVRVLRDALEEAVSGASRAAVTCRTPSPPPRNVATSENAEVMAELARLKSDIAELQTVNERLKARVASDVLLRREVARMEANTKRARSQRRMQDLALTRLQAAERVAMEAYDDLMYVRRFDAQHAPVGSSAILVFTDFLYDALLRQEYPELRHMMFALCRATIRAEATHHNGVEIVAHEDQSLHAFYAPVDALHFAVDLHRALMCVSWPPVVMGHPALRVVSDGGVVLYRGMRARNAIVCGHFVLEFDTQTARPRYCGPALNEAVAFATAARLGEIRGNREFCDRLEKSVSNESRGMARLESEVCIVPLDEVSLKNLKGATRRISGSSMTSKASAVTLQGVTGCYTFLPASLALRATSAACRIPSQHEATMQAERERKSLCVARWIHYTSEELLPKKAPPDAATAKRGCNQAALFGIALQVLQAREATLMEIEDKASAAAGARATVAAVPSPPPAMVCCFLDVVDLHLLDPASSVACTIDRMVVGIVRRLLQECSGREIKAHATTFLTVFSDPAKAIRFATTLQEVLVDTVWPKEVLQLESSGFRFGVVLRQELSDSVGSATLGTQKTPKNGSSVSLLSGSPVRQTQEYAYVFRGPRVRMGMSFGCCAIESDETNVEYTGVVVEEALTCLTVCRPGEVVITNQLYKAAKREKGALRGIYVGDAAPHAMRYVGGPVHSILPPRLTARQRHWAAVSADSTPPEENAMRLRQFMKMRVVNLPLKISAGQARLFQEAEAMAREIKRLRRFRSRQERQEMMKHDSLDIIVRVPAPTGRVTIVVHDVEGSLRLLEQCPVVFPPSQQYHNHVVLRCAAQYDGHLAKHNGFDSFVVIFQTARAALQYCLEVQQTLLSAEWPPEIVKCEPALRVRDVRLGVTLFAGLRVRMGILTGAVQKISLTTPSQPTHQATEYNPAAIGAASRLSRAAHGGEILLNAEAYEELQTTHGMDDGLGAVDTFKVEVKPSVAVSSARTATCYSVQSRLLAARLGRFVEAPTNPAPTIRRSPRRSRSLGVSSAPNDDKANWWKGVDSKGGALPQQIPHSALRALAASHRNALGGSISVPHDAELPVFKQ